MNTEFKTVDQRIRFYKDVTEGLNLLSVYDNLYLDNFFPMEIKTKEEIAVLWEKYLAPKNDPFLSFYTHIPFCRSSRCFYCMYNSNIVVNSLDLDIYLDFLHKKMIFFGKVFAGYAFSTFYAGGGTPSVMTVKQIQRLLAMAFGCFKFKENVGTRCIEFSPATATEAKIKAAKDAGITRLSMGIQSLDADVLRSANRKVVSFKRIEKIAAFIQKQGFVDFNLDLMAWLPGDSLARFKSSFEKTLQLGVPSVTLYFFRHMPQKIKKNAHIMKDTLYFHYQFPYSRKELMGIIIPLLNEYSYFSCENLESMNEAYTFRRKGLLAAHFKTSQTQPDYHLDNSMLGLGLHARSFMGNDMEYYNADNHITNLDFDRKLYNLKSYSLDYQMRRFVLRVFESGEGVRLDSFQKYFQRAFINVFKEEVKILEGLNRILIKEGKVFLLTKDVFEHAVYSKFFYDQEILMKAAQSAGLR